METVEGCMVQCLLVIDSSTESPKRNKFRDLF